MKAAVLKAWGTPLVIEDLPEPTLGTGEVLVDMVATTLPAYAAEVLSGARRYPLALPAVPAPVASAGSRRSARTRPGWRRGTGCTATARCARETIRSRPTSPCKA